MFFSMLLESCIRKNSLGLLKHVSVAVVIAFIRKNFKCNLF